MKIVIGDMVKWVSAAGTLTGKVENIVLDLNGAGETIPWMIITPLRDGYISRLKLCASHGYLKQLKVEVLA